MEKLALKQENKRQNVQKCIYTFGISLFFGAVAK